MVDESRIITVVSGLLKPVLERVDGNVASALASVRQVSSSALSYKASVVSLVENMLNAFKEDIVTLVWNVNTKAAVAAEHTIPPPPTRNYGKGADTCKSLGRWCHC